MKNFLYIFFLAFLITGCAKELEIEPQNTISSEEALLDEDAVAVALIGAYNGLQDGDAFGTNYNLVSELLAADGDNEVSFSGTFNSFIDLFSKQQTKFNGEASGLWTDHYYTINIANNVLNALNVVSDANKDAFEGEAKLIRALSYFELIRFFAHTYEAGQTNSQLGVPLMLKPTTDFAGVEKPSRATVEEIYTQIIQDLTDAEAKLSTTSSANAGNLHFTKDVATAVLAKVYLQQGNYTGARDKANTVITNGAYSLVSSVVSAFNNTAASSEDIFAVRQNEQDGALGGDNVNFYASNGGVGRGDMDIQAGHLALYESTDERRTSLFYDGTGRKAGRTRSGKWKTLNTWIPVIRLSEMYLIRAEGNARLGTSVGATALADINTLRTRAKASAKTSVTIDDVLMERRLELAWEGARIHDIKRTKANVGSRAYNDNLLILPIPNRDVLVNSNLAQNDGY